MMLYGTKGWYQWFMVPIIFQKSNIISFSGYFKITVIKLHVDSHFLGIPQNIDYITVLFIGFKVENG